MKLIFPNGEHDQIELEAGTTTVIGRIGDADIQLDVDTVGEIHARIQYDEKGAWISVDNAANITRVNGSLVVARTPVAGGDALLFGSVQCQVAGNVPRAAGGPASSAKPDREPARDSGETVVRAAIPKFILRGVSGSTFGKHFPLYGNTVIGRQSDCDVCLPSDEVSRRHAQITLTSEGLFVEDLDSANGTFVNGRRVKREKIEPGDELKLDTVRFLVQSPGQDTGKQAAVKSSDVKPAEPAEEASGGGMGKWIAIGVVVVIGLVVGLKLSGVF
ncbi:MAG: FHA domain-containing protein [Pseudomonadota bacterium]